LNQVNILQNAKKGKIKLTKISEKFGENESKTVKNFKLIIPEIALS